MLVGDTTKLKDCGKGPGPVPPPPPPPPQATKPKIRLIGSMNQRRPEKTSPLNDDLLECIRILISFPVSDKISLGKTT
jgi:hypothetical protein